MIKLLSTDLDGTYYGSPESLILFKNFWDKLPIKPILVFNTGRLVNNVLNLIESENLLTPDYIIGGMGTQIFQYNKKQFWPGFTNRLEQDWNIEAINILMSKDQRLTKQPLEHLTPLKSSWFYENATQEDLQEIKNKIESNGFKATILYSSHRDIDILPILADKGKSLSWLCQQLSIPTSQVMVAGDSMNDEAMFYVPQVKGVVVSNAHEEFKEAVKTLHPYYATGYKTEALLEGWKFYS